MLNAIFDTNQILNTRKTMFLKKKIVLDIKYLKTLFHKNKNLHLEEFKYAYTTP